MEKIIEEMARDICECYGDDGTCYQDDKPCDLRCEHMTEAQFLYDRGYRKERQGEWIEYYDDGIEEIAYKCSLCGCEACYKYMSYCPKCGAKMKGN